MAYEFNPYQREEVKEARRNEIIQNNLLFDKKKKIICDYLDENISSTVDLLLNVKRTNYSGNVGDKGIKYFSVDELIGLNQEIIGPKSSRLNNELKNWANDENNVGQEIYIRKLNEFRKFDYVVNYCSKK